MKVGAYNSMVRYVSEVIEGFEKEQYTNRRVSTKIWKHILLTNKDNIVIRCRSTQLVAKSIGCGVYEITLKET